MAGSARSRDPIFQASLKSRDALQVEPLLKLRRTEAQAAGCTVMGAVGSVPDASVAEKDESPALGSEAAFDEHLSVAEKIEWFDRSVNAGGAGGRLPPAVRF